MSSSARRLDPAGGRWPTTLPLFFFSRTRGCHVRSSGARRRTTLISGGAEARNGSRAARPPPRGTTRVAVESRRPRIFGRVALEALVAAQPHPSADDVAGRIAETAPEIHLSTVYRTLGTLTELGVDPGAVDAVAADAVVDPTAATNPVELTPDLAAAIFDAAITGTLDG